MTMTNNVHSHFDRLQVWFVAEVMVFFQHCWRLTHVEILDCHYDQPHTYRIEAARPFFIQRYPQVVTFTTSDAGRLPLPSPRYLEIHAACAKIAHLSGAAEYIERVLEYVEEISVLADHGSWIIGRGFVTPCAS